MVACVILNRITIVFTTDTFLIRITLVSTTKALLRCVLKCRKMIRKRNGKCLENYLRNMSYKSRNFPKSSDFHIYVLIFPLHKKKENYVCFTYFRTLLTGFIVSIVTTVMSPRASHQISIISLIFTYTNNLFSI